MRQWHHACASWNGKTGEWQLWVKSERVGRGFHNRVSKKILWYNTVLWLNLQFLAGRLWNQTERKIIFWWPIDNRSNWYWLAFRVDNGPTLQGRLECRKSTSRSQTSSRSPLRSPRRGNYSSTTGGNSTGEYFEHTIQILPSVVFSLCHQAVRRKTESRRDPKCNFLSNVCLDSNRIDNNWSNFYLRFMV